MGLCGMLQQQDMRRVGYLAELMNVGGLSFLGIKINDSYSECLIENSALHGVGHGVASFLMIHAFCCKQRLHQIGVNITFWNNKQVSHRQPSVSILKNASSP